MSNNYEDRITYRKGNVIGLNFASLRYEIEDFQRRSEGCERNESCQVISLDDYKVERTSNNTYVKGLSLENALQQTPLEQRRSRNGENVSKFVNKLFGKSSKPSSTRFKGNSKVIDLSQIGNKAHREFGLINAINYARENGIFDGFLHKEHVKNFLHRELSQFGDDLEPLHYLHKRELIDLGYNPDYYHTGSLESRIEGRIN